MAITRANVEAVLVQRLGKWLTMAGLDGATVSGANASLNDPIGFAVRKVGLTVASVAAVADADLSGVSADDTDLLLDLAEYRTLQSILGNYDAVNLSVGGRSESYSDFATRVKDLLELKKAWLLTTYGLGLGTLTAGVIQLDFEQRIDALSTTILDS